MTFLAKRSRLSKRARMKSKGRSLAVSPEAREMINQKPKADNQTLEETLC